MNDKEFNPLYDSHFLIQYDDDEYRSTGRYLVELFPDELTKLSNEIDCVLQRRCGLRSSAVID